MKIEKISDNTIRAIISIKDLKERNINVDTLNYNSPEARRLFWEMMDEAEAKLGFCPDDAQLCVEALMDNSEEFIIMITKIEQKVEAKQKIEQDDYINPILKYIKKSQNNEKKLKVPSVKINSHTIIFAFASSDDMYTATYSIYEKYLGKSALYKLNNTYYLVLSNKDWVGSASVLYENILNEYGSKVPNPGFYESYLSEHGTILAEYNALDIIAQFFC